MTKQVFNHRRDLPHLQREGRPLFIDFKTKGNWILPPESRDIVLACLLFQHKRMFRLHAAVVMPDHVHAILLAMRYDGGKLWSIPQMMQNVKSVSAHRINELLGRSGPVWQRECFDRIVRSQESFREKHAYLVENPRVAGLVEDPLQYRWLWLDPEPFEFCW